MSLLGKLAKVAGGAIGGAIGGPVGAKIGAGLGGVASSLISGKKGQKAAGVQSDSYDAAAQAQRDALAKVEGYQQPYQQAGTNALTGINAVNSGDYSGFENSPDFLFAQKYGGQAVDRSAAARGNLNSGNTLVAQQQFGQGLASQQLGAYRNSLFQQAGLGQNANNQLTSATLGTANNVGNFLTGSGDARASGIVANANGLTGAIDQAAGTLGDIVGGTLVKKKPVGSANALYGLNYRQPAAASV